MRSSALRIVTGSRPKTRRGRKARVHLTVAVLAVPLTSLLAIGASTMSAAAANAGPPVSVAPESGGGPYANGATVDISVGPNSTFAPNSRIEVIECAAPHGVVPVDDTTCDGNTAQLGSILAGSDGSFHVTGYTLYSLPNTVLDETADGIPVCNATSECVLYVGENQNNFSQPKSFSAPFTVQPGTGSTPLAAHHGPIPGVPSQSPAPAGAATPSTAPTAAALPANGTSADRAVPSDPLTSSTGVAAGSPSAGSESKPPTGALPSSGWHPLVVLAVLAALGVLIGAIGLVGTRRRRTSG